MHVELERYQACHIDNNIDVNEFCNWVMPCDENDCGIPILSEILNQIPMPFSVFVEQNYVDSSYRDTYYTFYSSKYSDTDRNCCRILLFKGYLEIIDMIKCRFEGKINSIQDAFIGTIVLRPIRRNRVGRILLDPAKMKNHGSLYIRTTDFSIEFLGLLLTVNAYPFMKQDSEYITCAEASIWTIFQYYGTRYPEYRTILPSEIIRCIDDKRPERLLPSVGMDYQEKTSVLKEFGFQPRIFNNKLKNFKNIIHYYVESGIPVLVSQSRHSIVCIGHGKPNWDKVPKIVLKCGVKCIDSADFYQTYVVMDDSKVPYKVEGYHRKGEFNPEVVVIPLYRRINISANTAFESFMEIIESMITKKEIFDNIPFTDENPMVFRILLTTSRKYQSKRSLLGETETQFYTAPQYPKFIWLFEFSTKEDYMNHNILGEIVIDATANKFDTLNSFILFRYGKWESYRPSPHSDYLESSKLEFDNRLKSKYALYENNLRNINGNS